MEFQCVREFRSEQFFIRKVEDSDKKHMGAIAASEYLLGRLYKATEEMFKKHDGNSNEALDIYWKDTIKGMIHRIILYFF